MELKPVNWNMAKNPFNWLIVLIMLMLGLLALELFMQFFNVNISNLSNNINKEG